MKLGKVIKNAGFAQRNVFGEDLISLRWAKGAFGIVNNLTKNFFAVLSFQWWRTVATIVGPWLFESGALSRCLASTRMGARSLCRRSDFTVRDLLGDGSKVGCAGILCFSASGQQQFVYVHAAALNGPYAVEWRHRVAWD